MTDTDTTTSADHAPAMPDLSLLREPSSAALAAFAAFVPELEAPDASAGWWHGSEKTPDGTVMRFT